MTKTTHDADVAFIQALAEMLQANDLTELQVKRDYGEGDSLNVRVSRQKQVVEQVPVAAAAPTTAVATQAPLAATEEPEDDPAQLPGAVTSPMVGTIYLQPEPTAAPFVSIGDTVEAGQTLLIVEAMKTMNQIPAPRGGTVRRILVEDGAPVEYGAPLMIID